MSVVSSSFRSRVRASIERPVAGFFGRSRADAQRPDPDRLRHRGRRARGSRPRRHGSLRGLARCVRRDVRPVRRRSRAGNQQDSKFGAFMDSTFDRAGEAVVYIGIARSALAPHRHGVRCPAKHRLRRRGSRRSARSLPSRHGRLVHGQLHARQVGEPRLQLGHRHGQRRTGTARGADGHPVDRPDRSWAACSVSRAANRTDGSGGTCLWARWRSSPSSPPSPPSNEFSLSTANPSPANQEVQE